MKILTAEQMRQVDRITIEQLGVPGVVLMENAGASVVREIEKRFAPLAAHRIAILCGKGNNGGDGFVVARQLRLRGLSPRVILFAAPDAIRGDARINYDELVKTGCTPDVAVDLNAWLALKPALLSTTLLIDAILGTGLTGPVHGFLRDIIRDVRETFARATVVAVDIPSGMPSDATNAVEGDLLDASLTVTFTAPKMAQILSPSHQRCGDLVVAPIGTPPEVYERREDFLSLISADMLARFAMPRAPDSHKGDFGHVLVLAGSRGKTGAAAMAGAAALKGGAGLVTVATAASALPTVAAYMPELMTEALEETDAGTVSERILASGRWRGLVERKNVLAVGPGLSTQAETSILVRRVVRQSAIPVVLDADGLNVFDGAAGQLREHAAPLVITPHPGEMSRLAGRPTREIQQNRVVVASDFARAMQLIVVLKGFRTLVATPAGAVFVNPTGNPGMATAGTGDVLTGLIAAMIAQYPAAEGATADAIREAVCCAVFVHGLAADMAVRETGEKSMVATDIIRFLPAAFRALAR